MIGKFGDFYVKKMQKFVRVLVGVLLPLVLLSGCTKKEEETFLLPKLNETECEEEWEAETLGFSDGIMEEEKAEEIFDKTGQEEEIPQMIFVHVCGAVRKPGVYELESGSRVYEAVEAADGFTENADESYVNQAQFVEDGAKVVIPTIEESETLSGGQEETVTYGVISESDAGNAPIDKERNEGLVNINTASREELMSLPGIGETRADAILKYRTDIGVFTSKEQLMEIDGIKNGLYSKIQDKICVE